MKNKEIIIGILLLIAGLGVGFLAGSKYQQSKTFSRLSQFGNGQFGQRNFNGNINNGNGANNTRRMGGNQLAGEIISADDQSITVKLLDGSSKIVLLDSKTTIVKTTTSSHSDLKTGEKVAVFGTSNTDGSVTAQNIQLNPAFRGQENLSPPPQK